MPGTTINRLCGSSLDAVIQGSRAIEAGDAEVILAGGVESMTRAPFVVEKSPRPFPAANQTMWNTSIGWRMTNPRLRKDWTISNGESAEKLAEIYDISREEQDEFAARSHRLSAAAWAAGRFDDEIVQVEGHALARDEGIRDDSTAEVLAGLRPAFRQGGSVTAGNSSPINDGASAVLLGAEGALDAEPLARIAGRAAFGNDPDVFGVAPVEAANRALAPAPARRGATCRSSSSTRRSRRRPWRARSCGPSSTPPVSTRTGGAIAIGHPLGASGGRIIARAAHELKRRGGGVAVAAICIGVGQGLAVVLER